MNKIISLFLALLLTLLCCCFGGCQKPSVTVSLNGSSSTEAVMKKLQSEFVDQNKNIQIDLSFTDSNTGIQAVLNKECDIGLSGRVLTPPEKFSGLTEAVFAYDAIVLIVNPDNPVANLSMEALYKIFTGEFTCWAETGGDTGAIETVGREPGSGTRNSFEDLIGATEKCIYSCELSSTNAVLEYVRQNAASIGYISMTAESDAVKALNINGVQPCATTVKNRFYPLRRPFVLVTSGKTELSEAARDFCDYIVSSKAAEVISGAGAVPVN